MLFTSSSLFFFEVYMFMKDYMFLLSEILPSGNTEKKGSNGKSSKQRRLTPACQTQKNLLSISAPAHSVRLVKYQS